MARLPLDGVRVLDLGRAVAGPLAAQLLGDLGADVIKVEPVEGDGFRGRFFVSTDPRATANPRFESVNRNKRSLAIDLKHPDGLAVFERLIRDSDVVLESYRPGTPERMGWGYERCRELNPGIIFASLTGYGETGPLKNRSGADLWAMAMAGNVAVNGSPGGEPMIGATLTVDHGQGVIVAFGIVTALFRRERDGQGCEVNANLLDTALFFQTSSNFTDYLNGEEMVVKSGRGWAAGFPYGAYPASDGEVVTMHTTDEQWAAFIDVLGLQELAGDPRCATQELRVAHRHELYPLLDAKFRTKSRAEWSKLFSKTGQVRADPALRYDEVVAEPQVQANQTIIPIPHRHLGSILGIAAPVSVDGVRTEARLGPPDVGEHTRAILAEIGYSEEAIEGLLAAGVVRQGTGEEQFTPFTSRRNRLGAVMSGLDDAKHLAGS